MDFRIAKKIMDLYEEGLALSVQRGDKGIKKTNNRYAFTFQQNDEYP